MGRPSRDNVIVYIAYAGCLLIALRASYEALRILWLWLSA